MRLKGKALQWLHSKSEYVAMQFDALLDQLRSMFQHRHARVATRKKFEESERGTRRFMKMYTRSLRKMVFQSTTRLEYIIDYIPDDMLQIRHAFRFRNYGRALKSFREDNSDRDIFGMSKYDRINGNLNKGEKSEKVDSKKKPSTDAPIHYHNCGMRNHMRVKVSNQKSWREIYFAYNECPFDCKCPKKTETTKSCFVATRESEVY